MKLILDPASSMRSFYFDKKDPRVLFGDIREDETHLLTTCEWKDSSRYNSLVYEEVTLKELGDFNNVDCEDKSFIRLNWAGT